MINFSKSISLLALLAVSLFIGAVFPSVAQTTPTASGTTPLAASTCQAMPSTSPWIFGMNSAGWWAARWHPCVAGGYEAAMFAVERAAVVSVLEAPSLAAATAAMAANWGVLSLTDPRIVAVLGPAQAEILAAKPVPPAPPIMIPATSAVISWTPTTTRADGTPLGDLAGYRINYGTASGIYSMSQSVAATASSATITALTSGQTWYFVVIAIDAAGNASAPSVEVSKSTK